MQCKSISKCCVLACCVCLILSSSQRGLGQSPLSDSDTSANSFSSPGAGNNHPNLRAFPSAEGFGAYSRGGRGPGGPGQTPTVYKVTTLTDMIRDPQTGQYVAAPGSLREAVEAAGPRFVIFRVGGVILLNQQLQIRNPYITIAGQTAPNPGITIAGHGLRIETNDVVLRHLRIRMFIDEVAGQPHGDHGSDAIQLFRRDHEVHDPAIDVVTNVIIDHCSLSWAIDETIDLLSWVKDITVQWSILSEASQYGHREAAGGTGWLVSRPTGSQCPLDMARITMHHNVFAHNRARNPRMAAGGSLDFRNNVVYNWYETVCVLLTSIRVNYVGNYLLRGLDTTETSARRMINVAAPQYENGTPKLYIRDNIAPRRQLDSQDDWDIGVFFITPNNGSCSPSNTTCRIDVHRDSFGGYYGLTSPVIVPPVATDSSHVAIHRVLQNAGATVPGRDTVDREIAEEIEYVHQMRPFENTSGDYDPTQDPKLRRFGVHHGVLSQVLTFIPTNDPAHTCTPRQYRMRPGMGVHEAKWHFLQSLTCVFPDGLRLPDDAFRILQDPETYQWSTAMHVIPDRLTLQTLYPTNTIIPIVQRVDSDNDGIPDWYELLIGSDPLRHDSMEDANGNGYLNIEEYLNILAP